MESDEAVDLSVLTNGIPLNPLPEYDPSAGLDPSVPHAPIRVPNLSKEEKKVFLFLIELIYFFISALFSYKILIPSKYI